MTPEVEETLGGSPMLEYESLFCGRGVLILARWKMTRAITLDTFQAQALRRGATMLALPMEPQPDIPSACWLSWYPNSAKGPRAIVCGEDYPDGPEDIHLPPYAPGQRVGCKETWNKAHPFELLPGESVTLSPGGADKRSVVYRAGNEDAHIVENGKKHKALWKPAQHMPLWAVRTHITIESVRPVRVEHVTEEEALAMRFEPVPTHGKDCDPTLGRAGHWTALKAFRDYWATRHKGKDWLWLYGVKTT